MEVLALAAERSAAARAAMTVFSARRYAARAEAERLANASIASLTL